MLILSALDQREKSAGAQAFSVIDVPDPSSGRVARAMGIPRHHGGQLTAARAVGFADATADLCSRRLRMTPRAPNRVKAAADSGDFAAGVPAARRLIPVVG